MDPFRSKRPGGADDIKIAMDSVPKRYRNKMPSFRHLKGNPCAPYFMKLLQCYVLNDWEGSRCISEENEFLHCRKNSISHRKRVSDARYYVSKIMKAGRR